MKSMLKSPIFWILLIAFVVIIYNVFRAIEKNKNGTTISKDEFIKQCMDKCQKDAYAIGQQYIMDPCGPQSGAQENCLKEWNNFKNR